MVRTCEALALRTYPFSEAHKVAVLLTRESGLLRGVAYGAKKSTSRFGTSLEPFTHVRLTYKKRENQELAVIQNCEIIRPSPAYQLDWEESLYLGYFAELLIEFLREQLASEKVFRLSLAVLDSIGRAPLVLLARYFEFWLLRLEGVLPALDRILPNELASRTKQLLRQPPGEIGTCVIEENDLEQLERAAGKLIETHLEKPLKAKRMLKELL